MALVRNHLTNIDYQPAGDALAALQQLMVRHLACVPFENIDTLLRRPKTLDGHTALERMVAGGGGWCFEMNSAFALILRHLGYEVRELAGAVDTRGDHLCLLVLLDQPYLVDVGFGGALTQPLPLSHGQWHCSPYTIELTQIDDDHWRFDESLGGVSNGFAFATAPAQPGDLEARNQ